VSKIYPNTNDPVLQNACRINKTKIFDSYITQGVGKHWLFLETIYLKYYLSLK
jgi:hypothetical protein